MARLKDFPEPMRSQEWACPVNFAGSRRQKKNSEKLADEIRELKPCSLSLWGSNDGKTRRADRRRRTVESVPPPCHSRLKDIGCPTDFIVIPDTETKTRNVNAQLVEI